jgi:hypothetical protein
MLRRPAKAKAARRYAAEDARGHVAEVRGGFDPLAERAPTTDPRHRIRIDLLQHDCTADTVLKGNKDVSIVSDRQGRFVVPQVAACHLLQTGASCQANRFNGITTSLVTCRILPLIDDVHQFHDEPLHEGQRLWLPFRNRHRKGRAVFGSRHSADLQ